MSLVVLDGDLIGFKASAACEKRFIRAVHKGSNRSKEFQHRTAFRDWLKEQEKWEETDFDIIDDRIVDPIENCLHTVKVMVDNIWKGSGCSEFKIVVQGEGNFRDGLLLPTKYKSNRTDSIRPLHLKEVQGYLVGKYKAEKANGQESDDVLAAYAYEGFKTKKRIVQATVDKDAKQCMGWLYDWDKMQEPKFISGLGELSLNSKGKVDGYGRKWLYLQSVIGDPSDAYKPTELAGVKYGEKTALKDFSGLQTDKDCWRKMVDLYKSWYPEEAKYTAWNGEEIVASYLDLMQMYLDCAHMRRWVGDQLNVRDTLNRLEIEYE